MTTVQALMWVRCRFAHPILYSMAILKNLFVDASVKYADYRFLLQFHYYLHLRRS